MPIPITHEDGVAVLRLELGRGNAINPAFVAALGATLDDVEKSDARAVVLTGLGKVFCGGLDLMTLAGFDAPAMERFIETFEGMYRRVFSFPRPIVAAVNGHALAGGCVLAMACDLRVMADGPYQLGLNEVQLGIPFPPVVMEIARNATPHHAWGQVLVQGKRFSPAEAHRVGLVHQLAADGDALPAALEEAKLFAAAGRDAVSIVKAELVARVLANVAPIDAGKKRRFLESWFGADAQGRIGALRAQLEKPRGS
jgi:enoyl-CoA hydratase